jgi:hypothetical protein
MAVLFGFKNRRDQLPERSHSVCPRSADLHCVTDVVNLKLALGMCGPPSRQAESALWSDLVQVRPCHSSGG